MDEVGVMACKDAARLVYGELWQSALARALAVSDRTVRKWVAGDSAWPAYAALHLLSAVQDRAVELDHVQWRLREATRDLEGDLEGTYSP
jgi:DNA-binding transcriptional regulator YdaS (Cro superfamily)